MKCAILYHCDLYADLRKRENDSFYEKQRTKYIIYKLQ